MTETKLQIDIGCGLDKRPGYVGVDTVELPTVEHVVDLAREPLPFDDDSVDAVFSSNFLERLDEPNHLFSEIGRVCRDGARIEFWTPYAWANEGFLYGTVRNISEELWNQVCLSHRDAYAPMVRGRWILRRFVFVVPEPILDELRDRGVDLDFAVRYYKGVVHELGVEMEYRTDLDTPPVVPERTYATERFGARVPIGDTPLTVRAEARAIASSTATRSRALVARVLHSARDRLSGPGCADGPAG